MPDLGEPDEKNTEKRRFISEKIVRQPLSKRQLLKRAVALLCAGAVFGVVAAVTFAISKPLADKYLVGEEEPDGVLITIPKDEPEPSALPEESTQETVEKETEPIEDMLKEALENYHRRYTMEDLDSLFANLRTLSQDVDKGIVSVHSVRTEVDLFDNPVENTGLYAGAVTALANGELLILTSEGAVEQADSIKVVFSDGSEAAGSIKQRDRVLGMAMVSVASTDLDRELLTEIKPIELGNSYSVKQGDVLLAVGGPAGIIHSTSHGFVSYVMKNVQTADGVTRLIYADLKGDAQTGTFLVNTSGQMVGWATDNYKNEGSQQLTVVMPISEYKSTLEKMSNGVEVPYFGIKGQEVSQALNDSGMPLGVYVTECIPEGPAYNANIQSGDIITEMGGQKIVTMKDFQVKLESLKKDEVVTVAVQRNGREEYKKLEYQVTVGAR